MILCVTSITLSQEVADHILLDSQFRLGGDLYDYEQEHGHRHRSLEPPDWTGFDEQARRRDNHYRNRLGESWGLAEYHGYRGRHQHEQNVLRERERDERRRRRRREQEELAEENPYDFEGEGFEGDFYAV